MTFIIAELGVNWRNLNEADELIKQCAEVGVDAVKFQAYKFFREYTPLNTHLNSIILKPDTIPYLYWRCCNAGVELMATPMYPEAVKILDPYVKRWKIREKDHLNGALIDVCLKTHKELLISSENKMAWNYDPCRPKISQLYCCPEYPPKDYPTIENLEVMDGYSCHIPNIKHIIFAANKFQLKYLEVHVKKNSYPDGYCPIDNNVSITVDELKKVVDGIN